MISVIITNYKHQQYLMCAVQSILNQTYQDFEIIIINDDPDVDIDAYETIDNRIKVYNNSEHSGQVFSINRGTKLARGEYIAYQDADDHSIPCRLGIELKTIKQGFDIVYSDCITKRNNKDHYTKAPWACLETLKYRSVGVWSSVMVSAKFAQDTPYVYRGYGNDRIWWIDALHKTNKVAYIPLPLYYYRFDTGNYRNRTPIIRRFHHKKLKEKLQKAAEDRFRYWADLAQQNKK